MPQVRVPSRTSSVPESGDGVVVLLMDTFGLVDVPENADSQSISKLPLLDIHGDKKSS